MKPYFLSCLTNVLLISGALQGCKVELTSVYCFFTVYHSFDVAFKMLKCGFANANTKGHLEI